MPNPETADDWMDAQADFAAWADSADDAREEPDFEDILRREEAAFEAEMGW